MQRDYTEGSSGVSGGLWQVCSLPCKHSFSEKSHHPLPSSDLSILSTCTCRMSWASVDLAHHWLQDWPSWDPSRGGWHPAGVEAEGPVAQHLFKTTGKATHVLSNRWNFAFSFIYLRMNFSLKRPLCRWRRSTKGISNFQQEYYTFVFITICV